MSTVNKNQQTPINPMIKYLTDDELNVIELIKKGEPITGHEIMVNSINGFIDMVITQRKLYN